MCDRWKEILENQEDDFDEIIKEINDYIDDQIEESPYDNIEIIVGKDTEPNVNLLLTGRQLQHILKYKEEYIDYYEQEHGLDVVISSHERGAQLIFNRPE